jgi:hypothetical protein
MKNIFDIRQEYIIMKITKPTYGPEAYRNGWNATIRDAQIAFYYRLFKLSILLKYLQ